VGIGGRIVRAARAAADWLLWAGLGAGLGLYFGLATLRGAGHTPAEDHWADGVRLGALALACACPGMLLLGWTGRRLASARKTSAAKREAKRATLLRHSDPVQAAVDANTARIDGLEREVRFMTAALADVVRQDGAPAADLDQTRPMLRIVGNGRNSA